VIGLEIAGGVDVRGMEEENLNFKGITGTQAKSMISDQVIQSEITLCISRCHTALGVQKPLNLPLV